MLELCKTGLYRRQLLCYPFFSLGNVFTHKCSENAFSLICMCYHLSGEAVAKRGKQAGLLSGTGVPLAGKILCCGTANSAGLGQGFLSLSFQYVVHRYLISVFMWCQQNPRNRVWSVYHYLTVNSAFQLNSANGKFKIEA